MLFSSLFSSPHVAYNALTVHTPPAIAQAAAAAAPEYAYATPATTTIVNTYVTNPVARVEYAPLPGQYVTQGELTAQLLQLADSLTQKFSAPVTAAVPQYAELTATTSPPMQQRATSATLSGVTITNSTIDTASIPNLSREYLSLNGGTMTGAFQNSGTASSSFTSALGIGTTSPSDLLAVNGPIFLGKTGRVTFKQNVARLSFGEGARLPRANLNSTWRPISSRAHLNRT